MNPTWMAMGAAGAAVSFLVLSFGACSLLSGALGALFSRPTLTILTSKDPDTLVLGFLKCSLPLDSVKVALFHPFGAGRFDVSHSFSPVSSPAIVSVDLGPLAKILAESPQGGILHIEVGASQERAFFQYDMKIKTFLTLREKASLSAEEFSERTQTKAPPPVFSIPKRSFVAAPLPKKALKISTNPAFAEEFTPAQAETKENFTVSKVWIDPGCIVCNACEGIYPEVFEVTDTTCLIRPEAPLEDGLRILEAAEACPVEVIKFEKA